MYVHMFTHLDVCAHVGNMHTHTRILEVMLPEALDCLQRKLSKGSFDLR